MRGGVDVTTWPLAAVILTPNTVLPGLGGALKANLSGGRVHEAGGPTRWREALEFDWSRGLRTGATSAMRLQLQGYGAHYHDGTGSGWLQTTLLGEKRLGASFYTSVGLTASQQFGHTPFRGDHTELPWYLTQTQRWRFAAHWIVGDELAFNLRNGGIAASNVSLSYRDKLLEYGLTLRTYPDFAVSYNARVVGF